MTINEGQNSSKSLTCDVPFCVRILYCAAGMAGNGQKATIEFLAQTEKPENCGTIYWVSMEHQGVTIMKNVVYQIKV